MIVFIDDLDRCSPHNALDVLESIKILLGIEGIIFVIGISDKTISNLIDVNYENSGVKGSDYIKKIIQIRYPLEKFKDIDIENIIENNIKADLGSEDIPGFLKNKENYRLISLAVQYNPRELKRFINSLILTFRLKNVQGVTEENIVLIEALRNNWPDFYDEFERLSTDTKSSIIIDLCKNETEFVKKVNEIAERTKESSVTTRQDRILQNASSDLRDFVRSIEKKIVLIKNWEDIMRVSETFEEIDEESRDSDDVSEKKEKYSLDYLSHLALQCIHEKDRKGESVLRKEIDEFIEPLVSLKSPEIMDRSLAKLEHIGYIAVHQGGEYYLTEDGWEFVLSSSNN